MGRPKYTLNAKRDEKWWVAVGTGATGAEAINGPLTQGRSLEELERMIRDAIALMREIPADSFDVDLQVVLPEDLREVEERARVTRAAAEEARREAKAATDEAVRRLRQAGYGLRDVGHLLGISYQRVAQLAACRAPSTRGTTSRSTKLRSPSESWEPLGPEPDVPEVVEWFRRDRESH